MAFAAKGPSTMTDLIPSEMWAPVWISGSIIVFIGWFVFGAWLGVPGRELGGLWRPAIFSVVAWPVWLALAVVSAPIWILLRAMEKSSSKGPE
jgi:hypothetical protein